MKRKKSSTVEAQYQECVDLANSHGLTTLGVMSNQVWHDDPRRLLFVLSRYKFVAKMLSGKRSVLEVGCADAFGTRIVCQEVEKLKAIDIDPLFIADCKNRRSDKWRFETAVHDVLKGPVAGKFDGAYALDVLEHIPKRDEDKFVRNIVASLSRDGVLILGSPSINSQAYASRQSKLGHVNCKDGEGMRALGLKYFKNVFLFSMNDEVVHTGFDKMAHYLFIVCCGIKARKS